MTFEPSLVGKVIANYRLVTELGSGGMGRVFYAEHVVIGRRAAIKILHPEVSRDEVVSSRFLNEARAVNEIRHPNVVEITDIGREGDLQYIIMSFLEGETLGERLERSKLLDERTTLRIARQVAGALGAAHEHAIIHRDLKPDNVYLTNHPDLPDYVKVLDFGIAKVAGGSAPGQDRLTRAGMVLGTPAYMSPEQCRGTGELDSRSDIYSLGVMLYQMLTGELPFVSDQFMEVMIAHITTPPVSPIQKNPKISAHVNAAIMRALEKDPHKRWDSMVEFWAALENLPPASKAVANAPTDTPETRAERGIRGVSDKLTEIIRTRIETDRLVLPAMPAIAMEALRVLKEPNQTFKTVGALIGKDPLLSSRILKLANSAAFPGMARASTLEAAVARMGIEGLNVVLIQFSLHQAFMSRDERIRASFRGIWEHSLAVALMAKELCQRLGAARPDPSVTYLSGLLHDVGKPVVASLLLEAEKQVLKKEDSAWIAESAWRRIVANSHRPVGVLLAKSWNLPEDVAHTIEHCQDLDEATPTSCANVVCLANAMAKATGLYVGDCDQAQNDALIERARQLMDLPATAFEQVCNDIYNRVGTMLDGGIKR